MKLQDEFMGESADKFPVELLEESLEKLFDFQNNSLERWANIWNIT